MNQIEEQYTNYGDIVSAGVGSFLGVGTGAFGVATGTGAIVAAAVAFAGAKRRAMIEGLAGLTAYALVYLGGAVGYNRASEASLTPFEIGKDRGIILQRNDGSQTPYTYDALGNLIPLIIEKEKGLTALTNDYESRRAEILGSIKKERQ